jgi:hypothetical protein
MDDDLHAKMTELGELEQKIKRGETLLLEAKSKGVTGWMPLIISLGIVIAMAIKIPNSGVYLIITGFGLLYFGFNIWRLYSAEKQKKQIESELEEYRNKRAELQVSLAGKE